MLKSFQKSELFRFLFGMGLIFVFGILILPVVTEAQEFECEQECDDHAESVCDCIGCVPTSPACEISALDFSHSLNITSFSFADHNDGSKFELVDRLDRPPQDLL
jgi:hypothetical protein